MLTITAPFRRPALAVAAAVATLAFGAPAMASATADGPTIVVPVSAADLSSSGTTTDIHARIADAARKVCQPEGLTLHDQMFARTCYGTALRNGEAQLQARREAKGRDQTLAAAYR